MLASDEAYDRLRDRIVSGRLAPGSRLVEAEVALALGLSRTPVRSAIQRLRQEGYVISDTARVRAIPFVAPLRREDGDELFELLGKMESLAARRATRLPDDARHALADRLAAINRALLTCDPDARDGEVSRLHVLHGDFHRELVRSAAGPRLRASHDALNAQAERYERVYSSLVAETPASVEEHDAIIDAIRRADVAGAERATENNWIRSAERLRRVIERAQELGAGWAS
ncbi:MAG TPA: GntR family transcriptional regulator [Gemmatimonadaceae bacterium]|nr:GntR family transcriptional regulator [Gemmatimonadaceae bacterium]